MGSAMHFKRRTLATAGGFLLASALWAQEAEPSTLGFQVRGSFPESGLADAVGGGNAPGVGVSLLMENDLADYYPGWRYRVGLGMDFWFWGNLTKLPGSAGKVSVGHLDVEAVRMLRPGGGPYLVAGVGIYQWGWSKTDPVLGKVDQKVGHAAGTFGFGYRMTRSLDFELKALMGKMDPDTTAVAIMAAATYRF
ncbi:hypothetical protein [Mesoterricola silvestris]|uniref:Outer membrane protein beta-barrel domain-containing protein n=1 Tax=Mesoterricola silvestris TaxID=2927979 RepID=A0AA48GEP2_9BACT|nr:hypothetical protein [Mesoterricola silvestris]BDU71156.1 hypothetical protein METEAL_03300 [Mesoterricola silvestris]